MLYSIRHCTRFRYSAPVSESLMESRMHPRTEGTQRCLTFHLSVSPRCRVFSYRDHLANQVHHFDIPGQHGQLVIVAESLVEVQPAPQVPAFLARQTDLVQAAGRTFAQVRHDLQAVISKDALSTQAYITLAQTRQISVLVSGEVNAPGVRTLSGLNTPIDAILLSGGVRKTGSLRNIVLVRGSKRVRIDLVLVRNAPFVS